MTDEMTAGTSAAPLDELLDDGRLLDAFLEYSPDFVYFKDREGRYLRASRSIAISYGLTDPVDVIGGTDTDFLGSELARTARQDEDMILRTGRAVVAIEERHWRDGRESWVSTTKGPLRAHDGTIIGTFGMSRDITDRKAAEELLAAQAVKLAEQSQLLRDLATRDDLSGLLNRRGFVDAAMAAMEVARDQELQAAMLFVDLDDLKLINDTDGHSVGDRALVAVADALRTVTASGCVVGRVGGDEFCVLETAAPGSFLLTEAVLESAIAGAAALAGLPALTASIGRVDATPDDNLDRLIARSDVEMYARKGRKLSEAPA